jgi:N-acetyl-anhydromuramoyl-L-alanine amidase
MASLGPLGPRLAADGLLPGATFIASPNQDDRPANEPVRLLVVHAISLPPGEFGGDGVERLFTNRLEPTAHPYYEGIYGLRVSAHFFIRRDGQVLQFVPTTRRAWHAGVSRWRDQEHCNDFSLGIELEGCDDRSFADIQYVRLARLIRILRHSYAIEEIVGHADIAPGRKTDPGSCFDWLRLRQLLRR